jgi:hypothetical protein
MISETVMVKWNGFTRKWYEEKGYIWTKQNDEFECPVEDLPPGSTAKVLVDCDYKEEGCKGIHNKPYRQYTEDKERGFGNCCTNKKCGAAKSKEIWLEKYGVDNIQKLDEYKIESRERQLRPFSLIVDCANKKGLILLTTEDEYKSLKEDNRKSRVRFICPNHIEIGEQSTIVEVFLKNKGCCLYGKGELTGEARRLDGEIVYQAFIDKGMIPKFNPEDYENNSVPLPYLCPEHLDKGIQYKSYGNLFTNKHKCYYCGKESTGDKLRADKDDILDYYISRNLIVEDINEYENKDKPIHFRCPNHIKYLQQVSYSGLKNTQEPCLYCRIEKSLSNLNKRLRSWITKWVKQSKINCNYKCIFTGSKQYDVHHLKSYNEIIKEALKELNYDLKSEYLSEEFINIKNKVVELHNNYPLGVCITNKIHILFHQLYTKEASIDDFYEFKKRYELGEFNELLKEVG